MKSGLNVLGIFLLTGTLLAASIALWNYFPSGKENSWQVEAAHIRQQLAPIYAKQAEAELKASAALVNGDAIGYQSAKIDRALVDVKTPSAGLESELSQYEAAIKDAGDQREANYRVSFSIAWPLAIFTALAFTLARFQKS